jgi:hypothetical protein
MGKKRIVMVVPSAMGAVAGSVRLSTNQPRAASCIQVPVRETSWPNQKSL